MKHLIHRKWYMFISFTEHYTLHSQSFKSHSQNMTCIINITWDTSFAQKKWHTPHLPNMTFCSHWTCYSKTNIDIFFSNKFKKKLSRPKPQRMFFSEKRILWIFVFAMLVIVQKEVYFFILSFFYNCSTNLQRNLKEK